MSFLPRIAAFLLSISTVAWLYLYLYPIWLGCGFPLTQPPSLPAAPPQWFPLLQHDRTREAPFRLLVLADPQLEGDTSLPHIEWSYDDLTPKKVQTAIVQSLKYLRKKVDLWGNDLYLAHIYRSLQTFTGPTHVTVLGDLLGSQWISDQEFERRSDRFWNVVFAGSGTVPEEITRESRKEELGNPEWRYRIISVVGNHDVGYAGDMNEERVERFERRFGPVNWDVEFELQDLGNLPAATSDEETIVVRRPSIRVQVLNSMNLDTPAYVESLQTDTYTALNGFIERSRPVEDKDVLTILLTHVPLFKPEGVCTDAPWYDYHPEDNGGGIREQNLLSEHASESILEGTFGMSDTSRGRKGIILTGHDHTGCDVWHYLPPEGSLQDSRRWNATRLEDHLRVNITTGLPGIREVTIRAMMGEFGGNAAFLSAWYDEAEADWGFAVNKCAIGPQHIWWAIHVLFLITVLVATLCVVQFQFSDSSKRAGSKLSQSKSSQPISALKTTNVGLNTKGKVGTHTDRPK